jgi:DNA-binding HxlR family transcriptional regulator
MASYGQFCPVALGAEIFAERWTPLILRELLAGGRRFSDIQRGVPRISRNLLVQRLESLQRAGIIDRRAAKSGRGHEYQLSDAGRELGAVVDALGTWGYKWASKDLTDEHLDPDFLMWALRRMVRVEALPEQRVVVAFTFRRHRNRQFWLVLRRPDVDLCLFDPGFEVDVSLDADVDALARVCLGHLGFLQAVKAGQIELSGPSHHRRALCGWLGVTRFATASRSVAPVG